MDVDGTTTDKLRDPGGLTSRRPDSFYRAAALAALAISATAFAPSLLNQTARRAPLTPAAAWHAGLMTTWLIIYFLQTLLVARGRTRLHRRLGVAAVSIAIGVVVSGYVASVQMARRGFDLSGDLARLPGGAMAQTVFQFGNLVIFAVLVGTALAFRRRPETHKRLMALAVIQTLMAAPLAHLVGHFGLPLLVLPLWGVLVLTAFVLHDRRTRGRVHPATTWGCITLLVLANTQAVVIGPSETWKRIVAWLVA